MIDEIEEKKTQRRGNWGSFFGDPEYRTHMEVNEGPRGGMHASIVYPDWSDQDTWVLTGTWGSAVGWTSGESARRFESATEAKRFYEAKLGKVLEIRSWGFGPGLGGRWGLRFRLPRPEAIPYPVPTPEEVGNEAP